MSRILPELVQLVRLLVYFFAGQSMSQLDLCRQLEVVVTACDSTQTVTFDDPSRVDDSVRNDKTQPGGRIATTIY